MGLLEVSLPSACDGIPSHERYGVMGDRDIGELSRTAR